MTGRPQSPGEGQPWQPGRAVGTSASRVGPRRRLRACWILGLVALFGGCAVWLLAWYVGSPDYLMRRALGAIERKDGSALVALADPEEITRLGIRPSAVSGLLEEILGQDRRKPQSVKVAAVKDDRISWEVRFSSPTRDAQNDRYYIGSIDSRRNGWRLILTATLRSMCFRRTPKREAAARYRRLAQKYGIDGLRNHHGEYVNLAALHEIEAQIDRR